MAGGFLGGFFYSVPPVRLEGTGYGELTASLLSAVLVPSLGFVLQVGDLHRLIAMATFPAFAAHMAMLLALELPDYSTDEKFEKNTVMVRMGWEWGMTLHNILILLAFVLLLVASILGFPWFATLAALGSLPVGLFQFWQMRNIANGKPVNWTALVTGGVAFYIVMVYLLTLAFWTS
jgi:1,4-dihydroxy-2-naphthoate octaprenyltransferase